MKNRYNVDLHVRKLVQNIFRYKARQVCRKFYTWHSKVACIRDIRKESQKIKDQATRFVDLEMKKRDEEMQQ